MSDFTDHEVTEAMLVYGGSFVKALAQAYRLADEQNRGKLRAAFADLFEEYRELAIQAKVRRRTP